MTFGPIFSERGAYRIEMEAGLGEFSVVRIFCGADRVVSLVVDSDQLADLMEAAGDFVPVADLDADLMDLVHQEALIDDYFGLYDFAVDGAGYDLDDEDIYLDGADLWGAF